MMPEAPEICSCSALRQAARYVTKLYDAELAPVGLGVNQYSILAKLDRFGPQSIQDLAALQVMDRSTLGHLLRPLERRKLVALIVDEHDRRSRRVDLTRTGKALVRKARPLWAAAEQRFVSTFGENAAQSLRVTLRQVTTTGFPAVLPPSSRTK
ncbi:MAG TPA: MarR family winged helix-turn-helix transcriptional regulator [Acidiphilium sp.]